MESNISFLVLAAFFGLWIITFKHRISNLFAILSIILGAFKVLNNFMLSSGKVSFFTSLGIDVISLAFLGFILIMAKTNPFAQAGILCCALFLYPNFTTTQPIPESVDKDHEIILHWNTSDDAEFSQLINQYELEVMPFTLDKPEMTHLDDYYAINIPSQNETKTNIIFNKLKALNGTEWIEFNERIFRQEPLPGNYIQAKKLNNVNDPRTLDQWNMTALNMDEYYSYFQKNKVKPLKRAKLYILDTGIDYSHEDLVGTIKTRVGKEKEVDAREHGTHCAGIAAATTNNNKGIASMSPSPDFVEVFSIKVLSDFGFGSQKKIIEGIIKAVDEGADVINMSLGAPSYQKKETAYSEAFQYAIDNGVVIVTAAGNNSGDAAKIVPANLDLGITVSALNNKTDLAYFSNHIENVNFGIAAPGQDILSTQPRNRYKIASGTSMAAPHVAGLVAVMKAINPSLDYKAVHNILNSTGDETLKTIKTGKVINPLNAVKMVLTSS